MLYLRARYYNPTDGRFQSRDTWRGDYNRPLSLNRWMYVEGNPVNRVDPSGHCYGGKWWQWLLPPYGVPCNATGNTTTPTPTNLPPPIVNITHAPTPLPTSTPAPQSPAMDYALNNWSNDLTPNESSCTIFLSAVLQAGGLTDFSYERTGNAYNYLFDRFNRLDFETNDKYANAGVILRYSPDWQTFISNPRIRPGDVVFYTLGGVIQQQPDHAAFIVSVGLPETTMFTTVTTGNPKPRIVEQDGLLNGSNSPCPNIDLVACGSTNQAGRSIDDTPSKIFQVTIFLMSEPK